MSEHAGSFFLFPPVRRGSQSPNAKLTEADVVEILRLSKAGKSRKELAAQFQVSTTLIRRIVLGRAWCHVPRERF